LHVRGKMEATGAGVRGTRAVSQTGTRAGAPPMMSTQAPGTKLADGHEAPREGRPPRPAASTRHHNAGVGARRRRRFPVPRGGLGAHAAWPVSLSLLPGRKKDPKVTN